jgi:D-glycero-D-manno-heptose 1,7-bisphosphate phosphatase
MAHVDAGLWCEISRADCGGRAALFLDRDGVIIEDRHYIGRAVDLRMIDHAAHAVARCNAADIPVVVVTNQSGIARGYYDWNGFHAVQAAMCAALSAAGAHLDGVLACAYHEDGEEPLRAARHPWRKPNPGMIVTAASCMKIDLSRSWIVGDKAHDLAAGAAAGLAGGTLLPIEQREREAATALATEQFRVEVAGNLNEAVARLMETGHFAQRALS